MNNQIRNPYLSNPTHDRRRLNLSGKRPISEILNHNCYNNPFLLHQNNDKIATLLRSVKPRSYHETSPISTLNPISPDITPHCRNSVQFLRPSDNLYPTESVQDPEKKILKDLEKQLLDDDDGEPIETGLDLTNEWSETIHSLMSQIQHPPSILEAASAINDGNEKFAMEILSRVVSDRKGPSEQRVASYMIEALRSRLEGTNRTFHNAQIMESLYEFCPAFKFGLFAANFAILDSTLDLPEKINILEFDTCKSQYVNLIKALGSRQNCKPLTLKITTVLNSNNINTGRNSQDEEILVKFGERVGVSVLFYLSSICLSEISRDSLGFDPEEAVVVNLAFKLYKTPDESVRIDNPRDKLIRCVKSLNPRVVVVVEQEMNANTAPFLARVTEILSYYTALFESVEAVIFPDESERGKVEMFLGRKILNVVACEGLERVERCEKFGKWRVRFGMAGLVAKPLSKSVADSLHASVNLGTRGGMGFRVTEESGGICFDWMGKTLTVCSAWR